MDFNLDSLLNLPNVTVFSYSTELEFIILNLHLINEGITCPHCNNYTDTVHQTRTKLVRDLSIFGRLVYLKVPRRQFYCGECKKSPTESLTWLNHHQRQTNRYQEYIYERVKELTVEQVSQNESIGRDAVQSIFHKVAQLKKDWGMPKRLSLDEFSRRKGQGNLATIVTDLDKSSLLEIIDSHKSDDIITALKQQPQSMREQVEEVSVDMWGGFPKVIRAVFPNAKVVIDRFHVQKLVNKSLNKIRLKLELKGLKNRCLLMSNYRDLNAEDRQQLAELLHLSPSLAIAHGLKEQLISIYESDITPLGGIRQIKKWLISAKVLLGSAADSVEAHLTEIANYFCQRTTSGVTEGINTRIKLILRQSYGFKSFDAMKEKLLACLFK